MESTNDNLIETNEEIIQTLLKEKTELQEELDKRQQVILELYKFIEHIDAISLLVTYLENDGSLIYK